MNDPLYDPTVVAVERDNETSPNSRTTSADDITRFFHDINERHVKAVDRVAAKHAVEHNAPNIPPYTADYKPSTSINKQHVYSINELLFYSKNLPIGPLENVINSLPKKKFWRLSRRYSDHTTHGKGVGHRNSRNSNPSSGVRSTSAEDGAFERRNSKGKSSRSAHLKRGNKFGKNEKNGPMEEKDITVNNDDLLALEEEFEPTGNSMADFETWKAKMKEMERKKKGLPINESSEPQESKPALSATSSSISDFLKLSAKNNEMDVLHASGPIDGRVPSELPSHPKLENQTEASLGTSSRFSSFFTNSGSNVSLPPAKSAEPVFQGVSSFNNKDSNSEVSGGSRLLSFFNKDQKAEEKPAFSTKPDEQPGFMPPPGFPRQNQVKDQPRMSPMQSIPQQQSQTNDAFFQGLLNKGKLSGVPGNAGPPPGVHMPNNGVNLPQQGQQPRQAQPGAIGAPPGFGMGMPHPHPGFPPSMQGSLQMPNNVQMMNGSSKDRGQSNGINRKDNNHRPQQQQQLPMQPGMIPPQFVPGMAPPGFPPMQSMPPNFNPNMYIPSNGMIPPNGQRFFPPIPPPPSGAMTFPPFRAQNNSGQRIPGQQQENGSK